MAIPLRWICGLANILIMGSSAWGQGIPPEEAPWKWVVPVRPVDAASIRNHGGRGVEGDEVGCLLDFNKENALELIVGYQRLLEPIETEYRVVVFDRSGRRSIVQPAFGNGGGSMKLARYVLSGGISADSISWLGVEKLDADGWSQLSSSTVDRYHSKGIETLPFPTLEHPYSFKLTSVDGKALTSEQFRGKVLIIQCWASVPNQDQLAALKALSQEVGEDRLAIVGINFDPPEREKEARWFIEQLQITWPQVLVLPDQEKQLAWHDIATISNSDWNWRMPTLVIDQSGILRANFSSIEIYRNLPRTCDFVRNLVLAR